MAPTTPATHDPALSHAGTTTSQPGQSTGVPPANITSSDISNLQFSGLDQNQIMNLLRSLPGVITKLTETNTKEDAAQALSNLAQNAGPFSLAHIPVYQPSTTGGLPGINDPGPSSHPRGPPNLGQLSAVAMQATSASIQAQQGGRPEDGTVEGNQSISAGSPTMKEGEAGPGDGTQSTPPNSSGGRRGGRHATMGSDEWSRQRKDNHKEVERRRRGNINEGINELGRIVPSGSGEKAKGAILSRAVQYIHHLKENEARNIEKWTLEKLLMDQAMGDLQAQLEEIKRLWEEERMARARLESEIEHLRMTSSSKDDAGTKRRSADVADGANDAEGDRDGKRQRTE